LILGTTANWSEPSPNFIAVTVSLPVTLPEEFEPDLLMGGTYLNIHTFDFPGGEIRGDIAALPEPAAGSLAAATALALAFLHRRRGGPARFRAAP
jgi:CHRD domain